jgi:uncharacterized protein YggT (Ycf19 family)
MALIDFILNLAGLLLWFNWRAARFDPLAGSTPATLAGTLRRVETRSLQNWRLPVALLGLLLFRALFYWLIAGALGWTGRVDLAVIAIPFKCDTRAGSLGRMLVYSVYSFGVALTAFHLWLLLLSALKAAAPQSDSLRQLLRPHLGRIEGWPQGVKYVLPLAVLAPLWWVSSWPLTYWGILPPAGAGLRLQQSLLIGLGSYLHWKYLITGLLALYFVSSYVFFGHHPFWQHLTGLARTVLTPLRRLPLRLGRIDLTPLVGIVIVLLLAHAVESGVQTPRRFDKTTGKELPRLINTPGLVELYQRISK